MEDLLVIYLQKLFELFFSKIIINNDESENITMNIVITVPNYFSYTQRKIIERIFKNKLFSKNLKSNLNCNGYNITLNNFLIEDVSNLASFCLNNHNYYISDISKYSNILLLYIDGGSVNLSIVSISEKMNENKNYHSYQIKGIGGLNFGEEDITNNFMNFCLSDFNEEISISCFKNFNTFERLKIACKKVEEFFNKNKVNQTEININKFYDKIDLKIIINRNDYNKCCSKFFEKIMDLIKKTLKDSEIKENEIDDIILIGNITKNNMLRKMIFEIFINNKKIIKENYFDEKMEYYPVAGAILQSLNSNLLFPNYKLFNITNISFGVESLDGLMVFGIIKGKEIPYKNNVLVKIKNQNNNNSVKINIYEGENKYVINNKLIYSENVIIDDIKKDMNYYEILFQFSVDLNNNLDVFILDSNSFQIKHKLYENQ
jgi:molecular chaperone DnaK (HSP70)